jgi:hypothetical protein
MNTVLSKLRLGESFLVCAADTETLGKVIDTAKKLISEFFQGLDLPMFRIVNRVSNHWLGLAEFRLDKATATVYLQKSIIGDTETLERVMAHELIHCWQYKYDPFYEQLRSASPVTRHYLRKTQQDSHYDKIFKEFQAKINSARGSDFITPKSNETYKVEKSTKEFYILIFKHGENDLFYQSFFKLTPKIKDRIRTIQDNEKYEGKMFRISDSGFYVPNAKPYTMFSPRDADKKKQLRDIYETGDQVKLIG